MTDETEAVARALAPMLEGGREYDQMPATRRELKIWNRAGMCSCNDATQDDVREAAQLAITALHRHRIERAGELEIRLRARARLTDLQANQDAFLDAAATIATLRAEIERLTEREAQAKLDGVRAGIEASAERLRTSNLYLLTETRGAFLAARDFIRALSAEAIAQWNGHASDCAVHNEPAYPNGPCDCGFEKALERRS